MSTINSDKPRVSVVIPTYNRADSLLLAIDSCLNQNYEDLEIVVVDDGSTDRTEHAVREVASRDPGALLVYVRQPNQGACAARNNGLRRATGEFVLFLDSDDLLMESKLLRQVTALTNSNADTSIGDFEFYDLNTGRSFLHRNSRHIMLQLARFRGISTTAPLLRRSAIPATLKWNTELARYQDIDFFVRYFLSRRTWKNSRAARFRYLLHPDEQISDRYRNGPQVRVLVRSAFRSWRTSETRQVTVWFLLLYSYSVGAAGFRAAVAKSLPFLAYVVRTLRKHGRRT